MTNCCYRLLWLIALDSSCVASLQYSVNVREKIYKYMLYKTLENGEEGEEDFEVLLFKVEKL